VPRKVIGSIDTSEFLVALAASLGFLLSLGSRGVDFRWALSLLAGGMVAAPIAAWLVHRVPPYLLGTLVGGIVVLTNTRALLRSDWIDVIDPVRYGLYAGICALWGRRRLLLPPLPQEPDDRVGRRPRRTAQRLIRQLGLLTTCSMVTGERSFTWSVPVRSPGGAGQ
jgi:hypothetical protein